MEILTEPQFSSQAPPANQPPRAPGDPNVMVTAMKQGATQPEGRHVARSPRDLPFLMDGDFLKVTNDEGRPLSFMWARKPYVVEPGREQFVPFEALVNQLGDPRSRDAEVTKYDDGNGNRGLIMDRHAELSRLFAMYSIQNEQLNDTTDEHGKLVLGLCSKAPKVQVETLSGIPVRFPITNPDMMEYPVVNQGRTVRSDNSAEIDRLQTQNAELASTLQRLEARMDAEVRAHEGLDTEA